MTHEILNMIKMRIDSMEEKKYLKWYNKVGYGSGDIAGNVVYAFLRPRFKRGFFFSPEKKGNDF